MRSIAAFVILCLPSVGSGGVPSPAALVETNPAVIPAFHTTEIDDLPDPMRSTCRITGNGAPCQFRFRSDGGLDRLTAYVTLRDAFDSPVDHCSSTATIALEGAKLSENCWIGESGAAIASCDGLKRSGMSGKDGELAFVWGRIGGRGIANLSVSVHCVGSWEVCNPQFAYTSTDLDADGVTSVLDFGMWAGCLAVGHQCMSSDYDCDCIVSVLDIAIFAGGLTIPDCL